MNENVGEQKLNCPLYEGPSEPSVRNSKAGANEFTINNYPDPRIKYHFRFQNADGSFVAGTTCMYWTVDFFHYDANNNPASWNYFLTSNEVFVCLKRQVTALGNTHISPL